MLVKLASSVPCYPDENTTEELFHQMEKNKLKSKDTVINLLLETLSNVKITMTNKQKDILSSHDKENTQSEKLLKQGN